MTKKSILLLTLSLMVTSEARAVFVCPEVDCFLGAFVPRTEREPSAVDPKAGRLRLEGEGLRFSFVAEPGKATSDVVSRTVVTYEASGEGVTLQNAIDVHRDLALWNRIGEKIGFAENVVMNFTMERVEENGPNYKLVSTGTAVGGLVKIRSRVVCQESRPQPHRWIQVCGVDPTHADTVKHVKKMDRRIECAQIESGVRCMLTTENELFTQGVAFLKKTGMEQAMSGAVKAARVYAMVRLAILKEAKKTDGEIREWYAKYDQTDFESCITRLEKEIQKAPQTPSASRSCPI